MKFNFSNKLLIIIQVFICSIFLGVDIYSQCPSITDILNHGWQLGLTPSTPTQNNRDEFGIINSSDFFVKVSNYPPLRSMPKKLSNCNPSIIYYMSFDTELLPDDGPIPENLPYHQWHTIKTFNSSGNGKVFDIYPPSGLGDIGTTGIPDFIATFSGVKHAVAWDEETYPQWSWNNFVTTAQNYTTNFNIGIEGPTQVNYNQTADYIVNINGGNGEYGIYWYYRVLPSSNWIQIKSNPTPVNYFDIIIDGTTYRRYRYNDEYRCDFTMINNPVELLVDVYDNITGDLLSTTIQVYPTPEPVTLLNKINNVTNFGALILNEDKLHPVSSNTQALLTLGLPYELSPKL